MSPAFPRLPLALATLALASAAPAAAPAAEPTGFASAADVRAQIESMDRAMKPGQGFAWQPLVRDGSAVAAIEVWKKPGRPAVHPGYTEYAIVLAGSGTMVSGGTLAAPKTVKPDLVEGDRIEGGRTRTLGPGDVILVPPGVPHWFGITGERLVLLGTRLAPGH